MYLVYKHTFLYKFDYLKNINYCCLFVINIISILYYNKQLSLLNNTVNKYYFVNVFKCL